MKNDQEVIKLYNEQHTCTEIARLLKIGRKTVYRILERNNVSLHNTGTKSCIICGRIITHKLVCGTCNTNLRRYRVKMKAVDYKGGKCEKCGWSGDISGYDFHHKDPSQKVFQLSAANMANMAWDDVQKELDKCFLLCALCHRLEHSEYADPMFQEAVKTHNGKLFTGV